MKVRLDYGKQGLDVDLPDNNVVGILDLAPATPLSDPSASIRAALNSPIGASPLDRIARGKRSACIVICDITRPVPNWVVVPEILGILAQNGISGNQVSILIATGTHRPSTAAEIHAMLGEEVLASGCRVVNHVCSDKSATRYLGTTPNQIPVSLNSVYVDADIKITCGLIEPHFMAGYSGGRKLIMPGIAALETVQAWHAPRFLEHPNAIAGVTHGNPVHEENTYIASMVRPDLIADVVLDTQRRITGVFAGDMVAAWEAGVEFVRIHARAAVSHPVDIVVTTSAGYPLDLTYYQTVKGMVGALPIVKPGGHIIIASQCAEKNGGPDFTRTLLETENIQDFIDAMQEPGWKTIPDQWQIEELAKVTRNNHVTCVCDGIDHDTMRKLFATPAQTVEQAIDSALTIHGAGASIAVIPKGPYVIPYVS